MTPENTHEQRLRVSTFLSWLCSELPSRPLRETHRVFNDRPGTSGRTLLKSYAELPASFAPLGPLQVPVLFSDSPFPSGSCSASAPPVVWPASPASTRSCLSLCRRASRRSCPPPHLLPLVSMHAGREGPPSAWMLPAAQGLHGWLCG